MPGVATTLTNVTKVGDNLTFDFSSGQVEMSTALALSTAANQGSLEQAQNNLIAKLATVDPTFQNVDRLNGSSCLIDFTADVPQVMTISDTGVV